MVLTENARAKPAENSPVNATKDSLAPTVMRVRAKKIMFYCPLLFLEKDSFLSSQTACKFSCSTVNLGTALTFHIPLGRGRLEFARPWGKFTVMNLPALNCMCSKTLCIQGLR